MNRHAGISRFRTRLSQRDLRHGRHVATQPRTNRVELVLETQHFRLLHRWSPGCRKARLRLFAPPYLAKTRYSKTVTHRCPATEHPLRHRRVELRPLAKRGKLALSC